MTTGKRQHAPSCTSHNKFSMHAGEKKSISLPRSFVRHLGHPEVRELRNRRTQNSFVLRWKGDKNAGTLNGDRH